MVDPLAPVETTDRAAHLKRPKSKSYVVGEKHFPSITSLRDYAKQVRPELGNVSHVIAVQHAIAALEYDAEMNKYIKSLRDRGVEFDLSVIPPGFDKDIDERVEDRFPLYELDEERYALEEIDDHFLTVEDAARRGDLPLVLSVGGDDEIVGLAPQLVKYFHMASVLHSTFLSQSRQYERNLDKEDFVEQSIYVCARLMRSKRLAKSDKLETSIFIDSFFEFPWAVPPKSKKSTNSDSDAESDDRYPT